MILWYQKHNMSNHLAILLYEIYHFFYLCANRDGGHFGFLDYIKIAQG